MKICDAMVLVSHPAKFIEEMLIKMLKSMFVGKLVVSGTQC